MAIVLRLATGQQVTVQRDTATIGQDRSCDLAIAGVPGIRPIHATIMKLRDKWMIESPGDWLLQVGGGTPGRALWLKPGDAIRLLQAGPEIVFDVPAIAAKASAPSATAAKSGERPAPADPAAGKPGLMAKVKGSFHRLAGNLRDAGRPLAKIIKSAMRSKTVRRALYETLGREVYQSGVYRAGLAGIYSHIDHLGAILAAHERDAAGGQNAGGSAVKRQIAEAMIQLGKISLARIRISRNPQGFAQPIVNTVAQLDELDK